MTQPTPPQPDKPQAKAERTAAMGSAPAHNHNHDHTCNHNHAHEPAHQHNHTHAHDQAGHCPHGSLAEHHPRTDAICIDRVSYTYPAAPGRKEKPAPALRDVTLHVEQGCSLGIIGPNGAGKSTLLKILLGMIEGYAGSVTVMGLSPRQACRRGDVIGYVPQRHQVEWRFPLSAGQVVRMGLVGKTGLLRWYRQADRQYAMEVMEQLGVADLRDRPIGDLSGGQQQRIFIARALVARPRILLFDEPTVGVDQAGQHQFAALLHQLHEKLDLTMIVVSHDIRAIAAGCNRVACLRGSIHYHDAPQGLTRQVLAEVFQHDLEEVAGG